MDKKFSATKILIFALALALLLPSLSVFARPEWKGKDDVTTYFSDTCKFKFAFAAFYSEGEHHSNKPKVYGGTKPEISGVEVNASKDSFVKAGKFDHKAFAKTLYNILKTKHKDKDGWFSIYKTPGNFSEYEDGYKSVEFEISKFEIPDDWEIHLSTSFEYDELGEFCEALKDSNGEVFYDGRIIMTYIIKEYSDHDPRKGHVYRLKPVPPAPNPEEEEEERKAPTLIPETGPRSGGGFSFYARDNAASAPAIPAKDPYYAKVIFVDSSSLKVLEVSNSFLPRTKDIATLARSLYETELANGNLLGRSFLRVLSEVEVAEDAALARLLAEHNADYLVLLG